MTYKVSERIYRTTDGRLVRHGDPEAAFLAFTAGQELSDAEAGREGLLDLEKQREQPRNKLAARPTDKAATRGAPPKDTAASTKDTATSKDPAAPSATARAASPKDTATSKDPATAPKNTT